MSRNELTYKQIVRYLKNLLSDRERYDLEKEMMRDAFDEEAFDGLTGLSDRELETDMDVLLQRLDKRIAPVKKRNLTWYYRIAAAFVLLVGVGSLLFFIFRTPSPDLITQEIRHIKDTSGVQTQKQAESVSPAKGEAGVLPEEKLASPVTRDEEKEEYEEEYEMAVAEEVVAPSNPDDIREVEALPEADVSSVSAMAKNKAAQKLSQPAGTGQPEAKIITGRIVGVDGIALPGVNVYEMSTSRATMTDLDGNFVLQVKDSGSKLALNYIGYKPLELSARDITGKNVTMQEDLLALEEVVVVGYGTQRKSDVTGSVSRVETKDISAGTAGPSDLIKPVPPGGSLKAFKNWVTDRVDTTGFENYFGRHRLQTILTIQTNGYVSDIIIRSTAPDLMIEAFKRVITQSPLWKPALKDNVPVKSEVVIRFAVIVE